MSRLIYLKAAVAVLKGLLLSTNTTVIFLFAVANSQSFASQEDLVQTPPPASAAGVLASGHAHVTARDINTTVYQDWLFPQKRTKSLVEIEICCSLINLHTKHTRLRDRAQKNNESPFIRFLKTNFTITRLQCKERGDI